MTQSKLWDRQRKMTHGTEVLPSTLCLSPQEHTNSAPHLWAGLCRRWQAGPLPQAPPLVSEVLEETFPV